MWRAVLLMSLAIVSTARAGGFRPTCNDDSNGGLQSSITQVLTAGTYYVVVDGFSSNHGDATLYVNHF